jgi:hypothetical protein
VIGVAALRDEAEHLVGRELLRTRHAPRAVDVVAAIVDRRDHVGHVVGGYRRDTLATVADHEPVLGADDRRREPQPAEPERVCRPEHRVLEPALGDDLLGQALRAEERMWIVDRGARRGKEDQAANLRLLRGGDRGDGRAVVRGHDLVVARLVHPADEVHQRVDPREDLQQLVRMRPGADRDLGAQLAQRVGRIRPSHGRPDLVVADERTHDRAPEDARRAGHHHGHRA